QARCHGLVSRYSLTIPSRWAHENSILFVQSSDFRLSDKALLQHDIWEMPDWPHRFIKQGSITYQPELHLPKIWTPAQLEDGCNSQVIGVLTRCKWSY